MKDAPEAVDPSGLDRSSCPHSLEVLPRDEGTRDEYTLVPRNVEGIDRMTRWITVDADGLLDLAAWR